MAHVTGSILIQAPLDAVYAAAKAVETFPEFMPDLESVEVLERSNGNTVSRWVGVVQGRKIRWVEEDFWDDAGYRCSFRQREGDFTRYEGIWRFELVPEGTKTTIEVDFELQVPLAGALLSTLLKTLMRKNIESMLGALRTHVEQQIAPASSEGVSTGSGDGK